MAIGKKLSFMTVLVLLGVAGVVTVSRAGATSPTFQERKMQFLQQQDAAQKAKWPKVADPVQASVPHPVDRPESPARPQAVNLAGTGIQNADRLTSTWFVDYDSSADRNVWYEVYLYAWKPDPKSHINASLALRFYTHLVKNNQYWISPIDVGEITITDISGLHGIVKFKTSTGMTGTFNLQTESWSFEK